MPILKAAAFITLSCAPVLKPVPSLPFALSAEGIVACSQENWEAQDSQHPCCLIGEVGELDFRELRHIVF